MESQDLKDQRELMVQEDPQALEDGVELLGKRDQLELKENRVTKVKEEFMVSRDPRDRWEDKGTEEIKGFLGQRADKERRV